MTILNELNQAKKEITKNFKSEFTTLYSVEVIEAESEYEDDKLEVVLVNEANVKIQFFSLVSENTEDTFTVDTGEGSSRQEEIVKMNDIASEVVKQVMNTIE